MRRCAVLVLTGAADSPLVRVRCCLVRRSLLFCPKGRAAGDRVLRRGHVRACRKTDAPGTVLSQHTAAVKGLAWCPWQRRTIATGGGSGDHMIRFWDARAERELATIDAASPVRH